jgi:four helix bundle protein
MHQQSNGAQAHDRSCEISEVRFERLEVGREIQMDEGGNKPIAHYRELRVYTLSYQLALDIHKLTRKFPATERFELGSQLRRAATSIPINIAEGYGRKRSAEEFKRFLVIALGSTNEVSVILNLAHDLEYLGKQEYLGLQLRCEVIGKSINKLIQVWR